MLTYGELDRVLGYVAGLRPFRQGGVRLELASWEGRPVVHNYGHGGAGVTLAPGSAVLAADLVPAGLSVAVLGAGVVGLCTAAELVSRGFAVTVYAREVPGPTSAVAGGVWAPVEVEGDLARMLDLSFAYYRSCPEAWWHPCFFSSGAVAQLEVVPPQLVLGPDLVMETFLVLMGPFLSRLSSGLRVVERSFGSLSEVLELREQCFVNCLGVGAGPLCEDSFVVPVRGQLVRLAPVGRTFTLIHETGYVISRPDTLLAGGTFEHGVWDPAPDPAMCAEILRRNREYFGI